MLEFEIKNYKTIKHIPRTSIEGYCSIQGRNHVGKSAILQAIRAVFVNPKGNDFIRHGESFTEVRVWHDGNFFCWTKERNGAASYLVNDLEEFTKVPSGSIPKEVLDLGYGPIQVAGEKVELYYAPQFEPLFLLDRGNSNFVTDLMAAVHKIDIIYKAMNLVDLDIRSETGDNRLLKGQSRADEESLKSFDKLDLASTRFEEALEAHEKLVVIESEISRMRTFINLLRSLTDRARSLKDISGIDIPSTDFSKEEHEVYKVKSLVKTLRTQRELVTALRKVDSIEVPEELQFSETVKARKLLESFTRIQKAVSNLGSIDGVLLPEPFDIGKFSETRKVNNLKTLLKERSSLVSKFKDLGVVAIPEEYSYSESPVAAFLGRLRETKHRADKFRTLSTLEIPEELSYSLPSHLKPKLESVEGVVAKISSDLSKHKGEEESVLEKLKEFKNCPVCGSAVGVEHAH